MSRNIFATCLIISICMVCPGFEGIATSEEPTGNGELMWAIRAGGIYGDTANAVTALSDDSFIVSGNYNASMVFGEGEQSETTLTTDAPHSEIFLARYYPDSTLIWAKHAGGPGGSDLYDITSLTDNSVVVCGDFFASTTFGEGEPNETTLDAVGLGNIFVARYNPDGTLAWAKCAGGECNNAGFAIASLSDDSIILSGFFTRRITFGVGEANETSLVSAGDRDIFIARYGYDGSLKWVKQSGGLGDETAWAVATFPDDSFVIGGDFGGTAAFGEDGSQQIFLTAAGGWWDMFLAKYNPDGTLIWARSTEGNEREGVSELSILSDNSIIAGGYFSKSITFENGETLENTLAPDDDNDIFIARYNPDGSLKWVRDLGSTGGEGIDGITTLSDDSVVVTGQFEGLVIFGSSEPNETELSAVEEIDVYIAKYNPDGTLVWVKRAGGHHVDWAGSIASLSDDSTILCGWFPETATFGVNEPNETTFASAGGFDIFIARYSE
jgi:uncharacterized delta-60 repeat protein